MSAPCIILASLPSFCQKLSNLVEIQRSSDKTILHIGKLPYACANIHDSDRAYRGRGTHRHVWQNDVQRKTAEVNQLSDHGINDKLWFNIKPAMTW